MDIPRQEKITIRLIQVFKRLSDKTESAGKSLDSHSRPRPLQGIHNYSI